MRLEYLKHDKLESLPDKIEDFSIFDNKIFIYGNSKLNVYVDQELTEERNGTYNLFTCPQGVVVTSFEEDQLRIAVYNSLGCTKTRASLSEIIPINKYKTWIQDAFVYRDSVIINQVRYNPIIEGYESLIWFYRIVKNEFVFLYFVCTKAKTFVVNTRNYEMIDYEPCLLRSQDCFVFKNGDKYLFICKDFQIQKKFQEITFFQKNKNLISFIDSENIFILVLNESKFYQMKCIEPPRSKYYYGDRLYLIYNDNLVEYLIINEV